MQNISFLIVDVMVQFLALWVGQDFIVHGNMHAFPETETDSQTQSQMFYMWTTG